MVLVVLIIGVILIVAAVRNSHGALFTALGTDVPEFVVWGAALLAVGAVGFVPGLKPVSRGLLALILIVLVLQNYKSILGGFDHAWQASAKLKPGTAPGASGGSGGGGSGPSSQDVATAAKLAIQFAEFA